MLSEKEIANMYWQGYTIEQLVGLVKRDFRTKFIAQGYIERIIFYELTGKEPISLNST